VSVVGVCEDEPALRSVLTRALRAMGHEPLVVATAAEALRAFGRQRPDVLVLDIGLPDADGRDLCLALRSAGIDAPVLFLTARDGLHDKIAGFEAGGDDYLTKPFAFAELLARVQALVRRSTRTQEPTSLIVADLTLDLLSRKVLRGDTAIELRPREFALLEYLMRNSGRVVSKTMILSHVWEYSFDPQTNIVDVLVSRLRDKIDKPFESKLLRTVRGMGYILG
jgi:two-component system OmpR family response regulator